MIAYVKFCEKLSIFKAGFLVLANILPILFECSTDYTKRV